MKTCPHHDLYTNVPLRFIHNAINQKQPKSPSTGEWIYKMSCILIMKDGNEREQSGVHTRTWMNPKNILRKINQIHEYII